MTTPPLTGRGNHTVWKYKLVPGVNSIRVPLDSRIVAVGPWEPGSEAPAVWIERQREAEPDALIQVVAVGTGHDVPKPSAHLGSAWCGPYMWHVYRVVA
jgi:hypothetical protein